MTDTIKKLISKKGAVLIAGMLAIGTASYGVTSAYLSGNEGSANTLYVANNRITVDETFPSPDPLTEGENVFTKDVRIKNTGNVPCFVRVFVDFSDDDVRRSSEVSPDGTNYYSFDEYILHLPSGWIYGGDSYFYYQYPLEVNETTPSLIKTVKTTFSSADDVEEYDIIVYAESIQTRARDGSALAGSSAFMDAWNEYTGAFPPVQ